MLVKHSYAQEDVAYLNVIQNRIAYDEGSGWNWLVHTLKQVN